MNPALKTPMALFTSLSWKSISRPRAFGLAVILISLGAFLVACQGSGGDEDPTPTEPKAEAVFTAAAQTAQAGLTARAATLAAPTETPRPPTTIPVSPTETTFPRITPTETITPTQGVDRAEFVSDVTIIDGTTLNAGDNFVKTWRLRNAGTSTWTTDFSLVFVSGDRMNGPASTLLPSNVSPGDLVDLSVNLVAPDITGTQRGYWMLQNSAGELFGIGPNADLAFYVEINVVGGSAPPEGVTSTPSGPGTVTGVSLRVDEASFSGECPHTFTFTAQVTTSGPTRVSLEIEAGASDPSYQFNLPGPQSFDVGVGTFSFTYFLDLSGSVDGWARVRTTVPNERTSNQANFSLNCE